MNEIVLYIIFVFAVLGCIDRVLGNKFGIGEKFEEGFKSIGNMAMSIIGMYSLAPVIYWSSHIRMPTFNVNIDKAIKFC